MSLLSEERTNFLRVNGSISVSVKSVESGIRIVVVVSFEISLDLLKSSLKCNFLFNNIDDSLFNVSWKRVISSNSSGVSVEGHVSKDVIFTWEEHLKELLEAEASVTIVVEECSKLEHFRLCDVVA